MAGLLVLFFLSIIVSIIVAIILRIPTVDGAIDAISNKIEEQTENIV